MAFAKTNATIAYLSDPLGTSGHSLLFRNKNNNSIGTHAITTPSVTAANPPIMSGTEFQFQPPWKDFSAQLPAQQTTFLPQQATPSQQSSTTTASSSTQQPQTTTTVVQLPLTAQQSQALTNAAAADTLSKSSSYSFTIQDIAIAAIVTSLGFVLASFWRDAIQSTVKTVLPQKERKWYSSYIIAAVITFILAIVIYLIIQLTNYKNKKVLEKIGFESSGELASTAPSSSNTGTPQSTTTSSSTTSSS